jgi:uncharacterized protein (DUF1501 family)
MFLPQRREWMQTVGLAGLSSVVSPFWSTVFAAPSAPARAKACILIFLEGGPSQLETFDPKPGAPNGGPTEAIDTKITGVKFAQSLPKLAECADRLAVIRSLHSNEGDHDRAATLLRTGYSPDPRLKYPALGSSMARAKPNNEADVPAFVAIGNTPDPGILGPQFGPFVIGDVNNPAPSLALPEGFVESRMTRRLAAIQAFNRQFDQQFESPLGNALTELTTRANRMRKSPVFQPYDAATEDAPMFERYGGGINDGYLARACIAARRFVEAGVRFVEIQYGGWDTHDDNFNQVQNLSASLDAALATLVTDLAERGKLNDTLIACFGEFGRTPKINGGNGRDHFPDAFSAVLAGGGIKAGQVLGSTSDDGMEIKDRPVSVQDFHATLFTVMGVDVAKDNFAPDGRLLRLTNGGKPVTELVKA